jgi:hypothetical protein
VIAITALAILSEFKIVLADNLRKIAVEGIILSWEIEA